MSGEEKVDAWMPLWIGSYLADTMNLSTLQHGAYLLILFAYWRNKGPLADDDQDMASITKLSVKEWKAMRPKLAKFFDIESGFWRHGRADKELVKAGEMKASAKAKGKAGAEARWKNRPKDAPANATSIAPGNARADPEQCPTPSPIPTSEIQGVASAATEAPFSDPDTHGLPDGWVLPKAWGDWTISTLGWDRDRALLEASRFADHHRSKASIKADWAAAWRLWCTDAITQRTNPKVIPLQSASPASSAADDTLRQLAEAAEHRRLAEQERLARIARNKESA